MSTTEQLIRSLHCCVVEACDYFIGGRALAPGWYVMCGATLYTRYRFDTKAEAEAALGDIARLANRAFVQQRIARYIALPHGKCSAEYGCVEPVSKEEKCR